MIPSPIFQAFTVCLALLAGAPRPLSAAPILDQQKQLDRWAWRDNRDDAWFKERIPFFESPDEEIDATYYYRWELVTKHMVYGSPASGYNFTEFINRPGWSGVYGSISCPMALQIYELRWLKDRRITDDYIRYWFETAGAQPRSYSNWYGDAVWANYLVNGDRKFVVGRLPSMVEQYEGWMRERWDPGHEMFRWSSMHDGMEFTIASRQTASDFDGADSYRPTLNSYIYGDLIAISRTAALAGDSAMAAQYREKADALKSRILKELWDERRKFFIGQFANDEEKDGVKIKAGTRIYDDGKFAGDSHGRELSGYAPWQFGLPDAGHGYEAAWKGIADPEVFLAPKGLYFTEKHDPLFKINTDPGKGCWWSGNNWPYANSMVLSAMANVLNDYPQDVITKDDYFKVFRTVTLSQRMNGRPYLAEDSNPDTGDWINHSVNMSEHYFHSSYNDLLITGLVGLRPRADDVVEVNPLAPGTWNYFALEGVSYHGHRLDIVWDRDGSRYRHGKGLGVFADGRLIAQSPRLGKITGHLPAGETGMPSADRPINFAVNNDGALYPMVTASSTAPDTSTTHLDDGVFYYHRDRPVNRWVSDAGASGDAWVEIDFGIERSVESVKLYVLDDGTGVRAPSGISVVFWDGKNWRPIPGLRETSARPEGHKPNVFTFPTLHTSRLRVLLKPQTGSAVGLTEIEAWGHAALPLPQPKSIEGNLAPQAKARASFTSPYDKVEEINDGTVVLQGGRNRWTAFGTPNSSDWLQLDFPHPVTVSRAAIVFWSDQQGVRLPKSATIRYWDGKAWENVQSTDPIAAQPASGGLTNLPFKSVTTDRLRMVMQHAPGGKSGVTEWMIFEK